MTLAFYKKHQKEILRMLDCISSGFKCNPKDCGINTKLCVEVRKKWIPHLRAFILPDWNFNDKLFIEKCWKRKNKHFAEFEGG